MELKLQQVLELGQVLELLTPQSELQVSAAFALRRLRKELADEPELFQELRTDLLEKHANKDEEGKAIIVDGFYDLGENQEAFGKEIMELMSQPREIQFTTLPLSALGNITISINALDKLIECGIVDGRD